jgi:ectoine hydroxylase-related dioxygenase (phytanoyl-CoA dioxygenase family)
MKTRFITSYLELNKAIKFIRKIALDSGVAINNDVISIVGLNLVGIELNALTGIQLRTNHYLKEALDIKELPSFDKSEIHNNKTISSELLKLANHLEKNKDLRIKESKKNIFELVDYVGNLVIEALKENNVFPSKNKFFSKNQLKDLDDNGYLVLPSVLDRKLVEKLSDLILYIAQQEVESGVAYQYGATDELQRVYNIISKHPVFIELLEMPLVVSILETFFHRESLHNKYVLSSFHSNIIHPSGGAQQLHSDCILEDPLPYWPVRLNINFILTDWTKDNGSTLIYPGSHKFFKSPKYGEVKDKDLTKLIAPKGSIIIWNGHLWHKSGQNDSNQPRFGLFSCFASSQLKETSTEEEHLSVVDQSVVKGLSSHMKLMIGLGRGVKTGAFHRVNFNDTEFENLKLNSYK